MYTFSRVLLIGLLLGPAASAEPVATRPPNILFILTDDQGWTTLSCYGGRHVPTPNLDRLAKQGVRFTAAYVTPQCTPTRAALLTGQHPDRNRMWHVIPWYGSPWAPVAEPAFREQLPREQFTLPKALRAAGYRTGIIGKWHLTNNADGSYAGLKPEAGDHYGFDFVGTPGTGSPNLGDKHVSHFTDEAIRFIAAGPTDKPWFLYLAHHTLHGVVAAPEELVARHRRLGAPATGLHNATYLAAIEHLDASVGRLLAELDSRKLTDSTMVVFLSDNGGVHRAYDPTPFTKGDGRIAALTVKTEEYENRPLRDGKGTLYEGGVRVPCIVRWPSVARPDSVCDVPVQATDWLATLLSAAGTRAPAEHTVDGADLTPLLRGERPTALTERAIYFYAPLYDLRWGATPAAAVRVGDWKLLEFFGDSFDATGRYRPGARIELYHLGRDISEASDLSGSESATAERLRKQLHDFLASVPAELPSRNPRHDPTRPLLETRQRPQP